MEQVDLNAQVDYRPNNRVMDCKRCQVIQHPPANGSTFDKNSPFIMFRVQNTGNTFIDPDKTRLNFKFAAKNVVGNGATGAAAVSCKNSLGAQVTNATNIYNVALSAAGISGLFSKISIRVGGSEIESITNYSDIVRLFQVAQVKQSTVQGLMTLTDNFEIKFSKKLILHSNKMYFEKFFDCYEGKSLNLPEKFHPKQEFISFHRNNIFIA